MSRVLFLLFAQHLIFKLANDSAEHCFVVHVITYNYHWYEIHSHDQLKVGGEIRVHSARQSRIKAESLW